MILRWLMIGNFCRVKPFEMRTMRTQEATYPSKKFCISCLVHFSQSSSKGSFYRLLCCSWENSVLKDACVECWPLVSLRGRVTVSAVCLCNILTRASRDTCFRLTFHGHAWFPSLSDNNERFFSKANKKFVKITLKRNHLYLQHNLRTIWSICGLI